MPEDEDPFTRLDVFNIRVKYLFLLIVLREGIHNS